MKEEEEEEGVQGVDRKLLDYFKIYYIATVIKTGWGGVQVRNRKTAGWNHRES